MASDIIPWKGFEPKGSQEFLIDNSVLLLAYAPIGSYHLKSQEAVTNFLERCKTVNAGLNVTSLVIAEFVNKVFRDFWEEWKAEPDNAGKDSLKKHYRQSTEFRENSEVINASVKNILKLCNRFPDSFNSINIDSILNSNTEIDFNDAYFIELCNLKQWIIVSRDTDIINSKSRLNPVLSFL